MSQENFEFSAEEKRPCAASCPLALIPAKVWRELLRPPFRKRHPLIFWILVLLLVLFAFFLLRLAFGGKSMMAGGDRIALVAIRGPILDAEPTLAWIRKIENNPSVRGVLLRIDSPGGGASSSQEIYSALARLGARIPLAASMGATAASGGYMVAMGAQRVFANPSTITGSIGVRMDIPQLQGLMEKVGLGRETLVAGEYKDAASVTRPLSPRDRAYLEGLLREMHAQFIGIVMKGRHMDRERAGSLANGKIFTGEEALKLGLIDALGGQDEALAWLSEKTGVPAARDLLKRPSEKGMLFDMLLTLAGMAGIDPGLFEAAKAENLARPAFLYQYF